MERPFDYPGSSQGSVPSEIPEHINLDLDVMQARTLSFLLQESYSKWGMELDHYIRLEDVYPAEIMEILDCLDGIRDQLVDAGVEWISDEDDS